MSKVKKIGILTFGQGINIFINILFMPYMARALSYELYGTYGQVLFVISFIGVILTMGLPQIINVFLSKKQYNSKDIISSNILASLSLGLTGFLITLFMSGGVSSILNNQLVNVYLPIYAIILIFSISNSSINAFLVFNNKVKQSVGIVVLSNIIKVTLVVLSIQLYSSLNLVFISIVLSSLFQFSVGVFVLRKQLVFPKIKLALSQIKLGFPLGLTTIIGLAIIYTDSFMVSNMLGVKEYAIYRNGALEVPFISTIYGSIAAIVLPEVTKLWEKGNINEIVRLKRKAIMGTMMVIYPIMFFLIFSSQDIITLYLGEKYIDSAIIFSIFNLTLLIRVNDYFDVLIASNKTNYILVFNLVSFIINIALNYFLIKCFDSVGAAISTVITLLLYAILHFQKTIKVLNSKIQKLISFKDLLILIIISFSLVYIINIILAPINNKLLLITLKAIIYFPLVYIILIKFKLLPFQSIKVIIPSRISSIIESKLKV